MANQERNGRNVAMPDENRPTWRPQDEYGQRNRRSMHEDDDRYADRYMSRDRGGYWEDRRERMYDRDYDRDYDDDRAWREHEHMGHQEGGMYGHRPGSWGREHMGREREHIGGGQKRQRVQDERLQDLRPSHRGKGPSGYTRSDERIRELVCEALTEDHDVDATHIEVAVKDGEVILSGTVEDRRQKRMAEDCIEQVFGVKDVQNQIRIATGRETSQQLESSTSNDTKRHRA
jgi:osmotically-inducible protein OsmY